MAKYFFHIRDQKTFIPDDDGMELRDMEAARAEARITAVEWIAADIRGGIVEITNKNGVLLDALPMRTLH